jgi:hypothetical protein
MQMSSKRKACQALNRSSLHSNWKIQTFKSSIQTLKYSNIQVSPSLSVSSIPFASRISCLFTCVSLTSRHTPILDNYLSSSLSVCSVWLYIIYITYNIQYIYTYLEAHATPSLWRLPVTHGMTHVSWRRGITVDRYFQIPIHNSVQKE